MLVESTGAVLPIMLPVMPQDRLQDAVGYSITVACPTGCLHTLAVEPTFELAVEMAAMRLEAAGGWSNGLLVAGFFFSEHREPYGTLKAACDEDWRGRMQ